MTERSAPDIASFTGPGSGEFSLKDLRDWSSRRYASWNGCERTDRDERSQEDCDERRRSGDGGRSAVADSRDKRDPGREADERSGYRGDELRG